MKRIICLILCILMLVSSMVSCKKEEPVAPAESTAESTQVDMSNVCEVPDTDEWRDKEFRVWKNEYSKTDMLSEGINGEVINDAVFKRNALVQDKYGIKITFVEGSNMLAVFSAGDDAFELYGHKYSGMNEAILNGVCIDLEKLTYMATEKSWWNTYLIDSFEIGGKKMVFSGDFSQRIMDYSWCIMVNKKMAAENGFGDEIYSTVHEGKWTFEKLKQNCINVTTDSSGDGVLDHLDTWGFLSSKNVATALMTSSGIKTVEHDSKGNLKFNLNNATSIEKLEEIWKFSADSSFQLKAQSIVSGNDIYKESTKIFNEGRALYNASVMKNVMNNASNVKDGYALVPMPKYNEDQENYISTFQAHSSGTYIVPRTVTNKDFVSAVLEYMCYCSTDTVRTAYYDTVLQGRAAKDPESVKMLDLIFATATTDLGLHLGVASLRDLVDKILNSNANIIASEISGIAEKATTELYKYENSVKVFG